MAGKNQRFEIKLYGVDSESKSGRKKIGETAIVEAPNMLDAVDQATKLAREGIANDAHASLHSITARMVIEKASSGNPFGSQS